MVNLRVRFHNSEKDEAVAGMMPLVVLTVGGAASSALPLFFKELGFLEEKAIFIRNEGKFSQEEG